MQVTQGNQKKKIDFVFLIRTLLEIVIIVLIIYTPLVFGSVHFLLRAPALILIFTVFLCWCAANIHRNFVLMDSELRPLFIGLFVFICLVFLQLLNLPEFILEKISPSAYNLCSEFRNSSVRFYEIKCGRPLSVYPHKTWLKIIDHTSLLIVFMLMLLEIKEPKRIQRILAVILISGLIQSFYGLYSFFSKEYFLLWTKMNYSVSAAGTFVNRNHFAAYLGMIACVASGVLIGIFPDRLKKRNNFWEKVISFINTPAAAKSSVIILVLLFMILSLVFSLSRMGIMSFFSGTLFMILMIILYNKKRAEKILFIFVYFLILFSLWYAINPIENRYGEIYSSLVNSRGQLWISTLPYINDYFWFGSGLGTFEHVFRSYNTAVTPERVFLIDHAHNDYLELFAETGLIGFISLMFSGIYFIYIVLRRWQKNRNNYNRSIALGGLGAIVYIIFHSFTDFNMHIYSNALLFHIIAAWTYNSLNE